MGKFVHVIEYLSDNLHSQINKPFHIFHRNQFVLLLADPTIKVPMHRLIEFNSLKNKLSAIIDIINWRKLQSLFIISNFITFTKKPKDIV